MVKADLVKQGFNLQEVRTLVISARTTGDFRLADKLEVLADFMEDMEQQKAMP